MFMVSVEARDAGQDSIRGGFQRKGILGLHTTLKLKGYPLSIVFSYAVHPRVSSEVLDICATLELEGYPLSVVFSYAIHPQVASEF
jgi:hypothetical protein